MYATRVFIQSMFSYAEAADISGSTDLSSGEVTKKSEVGRRARRTSKGPEGVHMHVEVEWISIR